MSSKGLPSPLKAPRTVSHMGQGEEALPLTLASSPCSLPAEIGAPRGARCNYSVTGIPDDYIYIYINMHMCMCICVCMCSCISIYIYIYTYVYTRICVICIYVHICTQVFSCLCIRKYMLFVCFKHLIRVLIMILLCIPEGPGIVPIWN